MTTERAAERTYSDEEIQSLAEAYGAALVNFHDGGYITPHFIATVSNYVDVLKSLWDAAEKRADRAEAERDAARAEADQTIAEVRAALEMAKALSPWHAEPTGGREGEGGA